MKKQLLSLLLALAMVIVMIPAAVADEVSSDPFEEITAEFAQATAVEPYTVAVHPLRVTGWATLRWAPSNSAPLIATYPAKQRLTVRRETPNWLLAENPETGDIGYIQKAYVTEDLGEAQAAVEQIPAAAANGKENLGVIDINGAFTLQCALADGYSIENVKSVSDQLVAVIADRNAPEKPILQLSVAYDEAYANVDRMNDLDDEAFAALEKTFTDADPTVEITYSDTGLGTRLMIAHLNDAGHDYLDFLSIYKGYFVECVMVASEQAADKDLTDEQIQMCIDFLTEMDFVAGGTESGREAVAEGNWTTNLYDYDPETNTVKGDVQHAILLAAETAESLKVGDTLKAGGFEEEIQTLEKDEYGDIVINDWISLRNYGGEYHVFFYEIEYLETYVTLTLQIPDNLEILDNIDRETGDPLEEPVRYTVEEFKEMLAADTYPNFREDNTRVIFDANGEMLSVERFYSPAQ